MPYVRKALAVAAVSILAQVAVASQVPAGQATEEWRGIYALPSRSGAKPNPEPTAEPAALGAPRYRTRKDGDGYVTEVRLAVAPNSVWTRDKSVSVALTTKRPMTRWVADMRPFEQSGEPVQSPTYPPVHENTTQLKFWVGSPPPVSDVVFTIYSATPPDFIWSAWAPRN